MTVPRYRDHDQQDGDTSYATGANTRFGCRSPLSGVDVYTLRIYSPQSFEWDPTKRGTNLEKHGIDFVRAVRIFEARCSSASDGDAIMVRADS